MASTVNRHCAGCIGTVPVVSAHFRSLQAMQLTIWPAAIWPTICDITQLMASALPADERDCASTSAVGELAAANVASDGGTDRYGRLKLTMATPHTYLQTVGGVA